MGRYSLHVPTAAPTTASAGRAPRRASLEGGRIGVLWNGKPNGDVYLETLTTLLGSQLRDLNFLTCSKPSSSQAAPPTVLEQLMSCHGVVTALGD